MNRFIAFIILAKNDTYTDNKDSIEYVMSEDRLVRFSSKFFSFVQFGLWKIGINIHNPISKECTPNFSCCLKS